MTTRPSDQSKYFSHHKNGVLLSSTQPSRRTLVKGAAWSVPVVAVATPAFAGDVAASPPDCTLTLGAECVATGSGNNAVVTVTFTYAFEGTVPPAPVTFTLSGAARTDQVAGSDVDVDGDQLTLESTAASGTLITFVRDVPGNNPVTYTLEPTSTTCEAQSGASITVTRSCPP